MKAIVRKVGFSENKVHLKVSFHYQDERVGMKGKIRNWVWGIIPFTVQVYKFPLTVDNKNLVNYIKEKITDFRKSRDASLEVKKLCGKNLYEGANVSEGKKA